MRSFRRDAKIGVLVLVVVLAAAQAFRIEKSNPPASADFPGDPGIKPLLKRACYDCHSNETVWPWYSSVAPVSWMVGSDVNEGRRELNFSEWGSYTTEVQGDKMKKIAEEMQEGGMPPWYYSLIHRNSRLSPGERQRIRDWTIAPGTVASKRGSLPNHRQ